MVRILTSMGRGLLAAVLCFMCGDYINNRMGTNVMSMAFCFVMGWGIAAVCLKIGER